MKSGNGQRLNILYIVSEREMGLRYGGGCCREGSMTINRSHVVSFLAGAALPALLLFFLASDRVGEQLAIVSSWRSNGGGALPPPPPNVFAGDDGGDAAELLQQEKFPGLPELLPKVAMDDRTVIITSVNEAWARPGSLLDLFRDSFKNGEGIAHLLDHVLVVAVDPAGFRRCKAVHPHCFLLIVNSAAGNLSSANRFMTKGYVDLVWAKLSLQQRVLELGYNFLFTDADIVWFRDPFRHIKLYADMAVSCDRISGDADDDVDRSSPNTGFYYVKSTKRTVEMLRRWQAARSRFPPDNDQGIFNAIKRELAGGELHIKIVFLDTALFGGFCQYHDDDVGRVCTMHANCCVGLENKVHDLTNVLADWKNYTSLPPPEKKSAKFRWTVPAKCKTSFQLRPPGLQSLLMRGSAGMASSKSGLSPVVVFLLGAASATALIVFVFTSNARPTWPTPETTPARRQEKKAAAVACTPRAKGTDSETHRAARTNQTGGEEDDDEFARMVRRAAMEDRTVIMTSVNEAWAAPGSLMDSFLESFRVGENISHFVQHIVVVAMDEGALRRCRAVHPHCYLLLPEVAGLDLSGAKSYMTKDYLDLVWSKLKLQQRVLELGYNLLFTAS
uniref:Nucleotide-diphospho-sugar transferase domain-containing protein n=1 Tax=Oryza punctata TaxID=4537 RepID=A0A0E0JSW9_ORYPU